MVPLIRHHSPYFSIITYMIYNTPANLIQICMHHHIFFANRNKSFTLSLLVMFICFLLIITDIFHKKMPTPASCRNGQVKCSFYPKQSYSFYLFIIYSLIALSYFSTLLILKCECPPLSNHTIFLVGLEHFS